MAFCQMSSIVVVAGRIKLEADSDRTPGARFFWVTRYSLVGTGCLLLFCGAGECAVSGLLGVESHTHHHMERAQSQSKAELFCIACTMWCESNYEQVGSLSK